MRHLIQKARPRSYYRPNKRINGTDGAVFKMSLKEDTPSYHLAPKDTPDQRIWHEGASVVFGTGSRIQIPVRRLPLEVGYLCTRTARELWAVKESVLKIDPDYPLLKDQGFFNGSRNIAYFPCRVFDENGNEEDIADFSVCERWKRDLPDEFYRIRWDMIDIQRIIGLE